MKSTSFNLIRYDADTLKAFDWKEPRYRDILDENGNIIGKEQEHLYARTLFIGPTDSIDNYVEVVYLPMED